FSYTAKGAFLDTLTSLSDVIGRKVRSDAESDAVNRFARIPSDSRYAVFSIPAGIGGGVEDDAALFREANQRR
ncbi:MAG: hypothetical protein LBU19_02180, partial [Treponema sp.]|nr:hypothetical protein [Treponema sp.]